MKLSFKDFFTQKFVKSKDELIDIILAVIFLGFIASFNDWGDATFNFLEGLKNFFLAIVLSTIVVLVSIAGQKIVGFKRGYIVEFKKWFYGILIILAFTIVTRGTLWAPIVGGVVLHHHEGLRLGRFRYQVNQRAIALVAFAGPLSNIALALLLKPLIFLNPTAIETLIVFNLTYALFNMLPLPPLVGFNVIYYSRTLYFLLLGFVTSVWLFLTFYSTIITLILAFVVSIVAWAAYLYFVEL
ncbi:hypothetical protein GOV04_02030 [Candidatus Woesearchaeota archaeon]|nr:hypothetical protein [Candidatus Woesearchaeota archaeon]